MLKRFNQNILAGFLACLFVLIPLKSFSQIQNNLIKKAIDLELHNNNIWLTLLHYKNGKSEIHSKTFFLSDKGSISSLEELKATIISFFKDNKTICKYPARFYFLNKHLNLSEYIKTPKCEDLNKYLKEVNPFEVYLIFSDAYINSPASMYGHTFLLLKSKYKSMLLGYAVNYAAAANPNDKLMYYLKGIFGLYKGYFSMFPYYEKVHEYANLESRDIWEYKLNINEENAYFIALHYWEIKDEFSYYYFFDKNCSYQILYLIQLAFPDKKIVDNFNFWVIPVDTIKYLYKEGIILKSKYRPSATSKINNLINLFPDFSEEEITLAKKVANFTILPDSILNKNIKTQKKAKILELAKQIFMYKAIKEKIPQDEYRKKLLKILKARSKTKVILKIKFNKPIPPEKSHGSQKVSIGTGIENKDMFFSYTYRTAYHSIYDSSKGLLFGAEILFPEIEIFTFPNKSKMVLNKLTLIQIRSFSIRNKIFKPFSWGIISGLERDWTDNGTRKQFFNLYAISGYSFGKNKKYLIFIGQKSGVQIGNESRLAVGLNFIGIYEGNRYKAVFELNPFYMLDIQKEENFGILSKLIFTYFINQNNSIVFKMQNNFYNNFMDKNLPIYDVKINHFF